MLARKTCRFRIFSYRRGTHCNRRLHLRKGRFQMGEHGCIAAHYGVYPLEAQRISGRDVETGAQRRGKVYGLAAELRLGLRLA